MSAEAFRPEQIVSARDFQRSLQDVLDRLDRHGALLVLRGSQPVAVLKPLEKPG